MADTDVRCHRACVYSGCSVVLVIVLLQCNIFKVSRWRSVFPWKSRWLVRFRCLYRCIKCRASSATVGFHDVLGAVGLVRERVVCAPTRATLCVRLCYWYTCCVVSIGSPISLVVLWKLSKYSRNKKLNSPVFWGWQKSRKLFLRKKSASRWPGWRIFWPRNGLAPLLRWRRHWDFRCGSALYFTSKVDDRFFQFSPWGCMYTQCTPLICLCSHRKVAMQGWKLAQFKAEQDSSYNFRATFISLY